MLLQRLKNASAMMLQCVRDAACVLPRFLEQIITAQDNDFHYERADFMNFL
jgi:hypothetical protein